MHVMFLLSANTAREVVITKQLTERKLICAGTHIRFFNLEEVPYFNWAHQTKDHDEVLKAIDLIVLMADSIAKYRGETYVLETPNFLPLMYHAEHTVAVMSEELRKAGEASAVAELLQESGVPAFNTHEAAINHIAWRVKNARCGERGLQCQAPSESCTTSGA